MEGSLVPPRSHSVAGFPGLQFSASIGLAGDEQLENARSAVNARRITSRTEAYLVGSVLKPVTMILPFRGDFRQALFLVQAQPDPFRECAADKESMMSSPWRLYS